MHIKSSVKFLFIALLNLGILTNCSKSEKETKMANQKIDTPTKIGVQLYPVRKAAAEDLKGTLNQLAEYGFEGVEFADYFGFSAIELKKMLDDHGLECCGTHIYLESLQGDEFEKTVAFNKILGNQYLIIRWLSEEELKSPVDWIRTANIFNEIAEKLKPHGMKLGYHNHGFEFKPIDGQIPWDIFADNTTKDIILQLDTGNSANADVDPLYYLERNKGRSATTHLKPYSATNKKAFIGEDDIDWKKAFNIYEKSGGIEWYIVEYEVDLDNTTPLEALGLNLKNIKKIQNKL